MIAQYNLRRITIRDERRRHHTWRAKHVTILYERIRQRKGHSVAVGAVARHLSEAAFWMLRKQEAYKDPSRQVVTRGEGQREANMVQKRP
jgi:hypothetical protein